MSPTQTHRNHTDRSSSRHYCEEGTGKVVPDNNLIFTDIAAQVFMTYTEATPGHNIGIIASTPEVADAPQTEITAIEPAMTHHTDPFAVHPHIEVPQPTTPEIKVDSVHVHPTNLPGEVCIHIPADHEANHTSRRTLE